MRNFLSASFERKDYSYCPSTGLAYDPIPYCNGCQIWLATQYNAWLSDLYDSRFVFPRTSAWTHVIFWLLTSTVEDCLEFNFKYVDYQTLAHLFYSSCVCWTSVRKTRAQRFLSVRVLIIDSTWASTHPPILTILWFFEVLRVTAHHAKFLRSESEGRSAELT